MAMLREQMKDKILLPTPEQMFEERLYIMNKIDTIGVEKILAGIQTAVEVRKRAYNPYSKYFVGATIICVSGDMYSSCNAEGATYTSTDHAESSAITKAISEGEIQKSNESFIDVVIVSHPGESGPCGECRQRIAEHCENALVIDVDQEGNIQAVTTLTTLLFYAFAPRHLE
jgi:cytidine deaminase